MFLSVSRCAEHMTQLPRLKVTGQVNVIYSPSRVISISPESFEQFSLNFTQMSSAEHMTQVPSSRSRDLCLNFVSVPVSIILLAIFIKLHPNIPLSERMCRSYDSVTQTSGQGHTSRSCDLPFNSCPLHIS